MTFECAVILRSWFRLRNAFASCFVPPVEELQAKFLMSKLLRGSRKVPAQLDLSIIEVKSKVRQAFLRNPYKNSTVSRADKPPWNRDKRKFAAFSPQFDAEFRRFPLDKAQLKTFEEFYKHVQTIHKLQTIPFTTWYTDMHGDLLPINNDDNFLRAVTTARPLLRVFVQRRGTKLLT